MVTVKRRKPPQGIEASFEINGAGVVNSRLKQSFERMRTYSSWTSISSHIKSAEVQALSDRGKQIVGNAVDGEITNLRVRILIFDQNMELPLLISAKKLNDEIYSWSFIVASGRLEGMKGLIHFQSLGPKTRMALHSVYQAKQVPLPHFVFEKGVEVVGQAIAQKMRSFIEQNQNDSMREENQ